MADFLLLMRNDAAAPVNIEAWGPYLAGLRAAGAFEGGSAIGPGACVRKAGPAPAITAQLGGYLRISAGGLDAARAEAISRRAVEVGALTYASVASILKHRLDQSAPPQAADGTPLLHENIRGSGYFH